jgi:hypothetical protein
MTSVVLRKVSLALLSFFLCFHISCFSALPADYKPTALYLTWQRDPTSTMTIQWISPIADQEDVIEYRKEIATPPPVEDQSQTPSNQAEKEPSWLSIQGSHHPLPENNPYLVHIVEIIRLDPNSAYQFRIGNSNAIYRFRTMPQELTEPFTFCAGGDAYHNSLELCIETNRQVALQDPRFVLVGGDLAYATPDQIGLPEDCKRWLEWLTAWTENMQTPSKFLIPLIVAIGNHEVKGRYDQTPEQAPFFYSLFAMPGAKGYNVLRFDQYLSIVILDSSHTHPINGEQTKWLAVELAKQRDILHRFAIYHVPAYPSVRSLRLKESCAIRCSWVPLFEKYGIHVAFESHDHAYKRTWPLLEGDISPFGVVYIGDGSWGAKPRIPKEAKKTSYLAKTAAKTQFIKVQISKKMREFWSITNDGVIIDHYIQYTNKPSDLSEKT